jgi:hypothetical protein
VINPFTTFKWYFNAASTPSGMSVDTTETYLRNAHAEWYFNENWCRIPDESSFLMAYAGRTTRGYGDNGRNTVGFGSGGEVGCPGSIACTRNEVLDGFTRESYTRLNSVEFRFVNGRSRGKYDVWSIMAHELGHPLGCDDQATSDTNVMYFEGTANDIGDQLLGLGVGATTISIRR